jgi:hypothetical protein
MSQPALHRTARSTPPGELFVTHENDDKKNINYNIFAHRIQRDAIKSDFAGGQQ